MQENEKRAFKFSPGEHLDMLWSFLPPGRREPFNSP
jgi:hypothetical protein